MLRSYTIKIILELLFSKTVFFSEHRKGVLMHTALGELSPNAKREQTYIVYFPIFDLNISVRFIVTYPS